MLNYFRRVKIKMYKPLGDELVFRLSTSFKIFLIPVFAMVLMMILFWLLLSVNLIFFEAHGYSGIDVLAGAYYDHMFKAVIRFIPWLLFFLIFITLLGLYVSELFLRSFKLIANYCEKTIAKEKAVYNPEFMTDLALLTSFSEYFFNQMENALLAKQFIPLKKINKYQNIHEPVFEKIFFLQLIIFLGLISLVGSIGLYELSSDMYMDLVKLSMQNLKVSTSTTYFFNKQQELFKSVVDLVIIIHSIMYIVLIFHFYNEISKPAFAIFATMKGFLKGDTGARVHLIGHKYVRPYSRSINKYLTYLEKNLIIVNNKKSS